MTKKQRAARHKLLNILPRQALESMSGHERPHMLTKTELVVFATERWDVETIYDEIERIKTTAA